MYIYQGFKERESTGLGFPCKEEGGAELTRSLVVPDQKGDYPVD